MFDKFFPDFDFSTIQSGRLLDLGCFTGGRSAAWQDRLEVDVLHGFDVDVEYAKAAVEFADARNDASHFCVALAESMPYRDESFDYIATFDVIEHVMSPSEALGEAFRILKPGGLMFAVFPTYWNPLASHLNLATRVHGLNLLFDGTTLAEAHYDVIARRGAGHEWYNASSPELPGFYKAPFLNGITVSAFREILEEQAWEIVEWPKKPIFTVGRRMATPFFQTVSRVIGPLAKVPVLEEVFLTSISIVLRKPA